MREPWNIRSRDLLIKLAVRSGGGSACNLVQWWIDIVWLIARAIVVILMQELKFHLLAFVLVVRHSNHAVEAGVPHRPGDEGLQFRGEHGHMFMTWLKRELPTST